MTVILGFVVIGSLITGFMLRARPELAVFLAREYKSTFGPRSHGERNPSTSLKTISSAQADFRANDRDWNRKNDFWRGDIAGLYTLIPNLPEGSPDRVAIKLIELSVAAADDRPVTDISRYAPRSAKGGYWYRAIRHADETTLDPDRFAACAYPDSPSAGRYTFIIDENNTIFRRELGPQQRGVEVFPNDEELKQQWTKLD
jgi:hypothetical protein